MHNALIVVDVQVDFCEGGALAVNGGNAVARDIATYIDRYQRDYDFILFTKDWHNPLPDTNGGHFSDAPDFVDSWPVHCVAGTEGACLHPALYNMPYSRADLFLKGQGRPDYSGFQGVNGRGKTLAGYLFEHDVTQTEIVGIAGDYCVLQTALDAKKMGFSPSINPFMVASVGGTDATKQATETLKNA